MKVAELLTWLRDADADAVVLLLARHADFTETEELVDVVLIAEPWTCERHREADGSTTDIHHPAGSGYTRRWNAATDESWTEHVVILSHLSGDIKARLRADVGELSEAASVRESAKRWAAQYSRTAVRLYEGEHESEPGSLGPLYAAAVETDPGRPLWERASEALHEHGYEWPLGPYPEFRTHTMFVSRQSAGYPQPVPEACVQILAKDDFIRIRIVYESGEESESGPMHAVKRNSVVDIPKKVIAHLLKR